MSEEWKNYDDRPLGEIAQDMVRWCIEHGYQKIGESDKEYRIQCPNMNCPSREKSGEHKAFDINKYDANYNCKHCGLQGTGLHGSRGLIAMLESGDFSPSAFSNRVSSDTWNSFKPKEKAEIIMDKNELPSIAKALSKEAQEYFAKRGIPEYVYRDTDLRIFSMPAGAQLSFMKQPLQDTALFFPIRNEEGEVIHVHYKLLHGGYYMSPGTKPIYLTKKTALSEIIVVEGVFDALSVYMVGYRGAALLGHEITANHDLSVFKDKSVVVMLDNDDAGKASVNSVASVLATVAAEVKIATVPTELGKDPNDVLTNAGEDKLKELISNAVPLANPQIIADMDNAKQADTTQVKVEPVEAKDKPKKENVSGIVFPKEAWRGIFQTYRDAVRGTTESPEQYHFGVLATIAGIIIGRACYLYHAGELYPNFYTAIVGPSGKSRKTTATNLCMRILNDVDPNVIVLRGLSSPEGLIQALQIPADEELEDLPKHEQQRAASVIPVASYEGYRCLMLCNEFASLLKKAKNESTSGIIPALNNLYDCLPTLDNLTRNRPLQAILPTGAMIALSTTEWLERNLAPADVFGGFANRFCYYNYTPTEPISRPQKPDGALIDTIIGKLTNVRQKRKARQTEYHFDSDAEKVVDEWYLDRWYRKYDSDVVAVLSERIDVHVRKIALLYAILENAPDDYAIHADQLKAAIEIGSYYEKSALSIFGTFGFTQTTRSEMRVIETLTDNPMTKTDIHQKLSGRLSATELERMIISLLNVGRIEKRRESYTDSMNRKRYRELYVKAGR